MLKTYGKLLSVLALAFLWAGVLSAMAPTPVKAEGWTYNKAAFARYLKSMKSKAVRRGVSRSVVDAAFRNLRPDPEVLNLANFQPEFKLTAWAYLDKTVSDVRIANGKKNYAKQSKLLDALEARYGVPKRYIVAIWGLESRYGQRKGDIPVIQALATLGYTGKRKRFGRSQLIAALKILQRKDIALSKFTGSWAGAMGHTQFIPTTYNAYAVDWTGDGTRDIWNSIPDALASTASYLKVSGWQKGVPWGTEVKIPSKLSSRYAGIKKRKPRRVSEWIRLGVKPIGGGSFRAKQRRAWLILPSGRRGPAFLVYRNFRAIMRYNNSVKYALAVAHLGDRIIGRPEFRARWPRTGTPLMLAGRKELQIYLTKLGLYSGEIDGAVGRETEKAIRKFQRAKGLKPDAYPSVELLKRIKSGA